MLSGDDRAGLDLFDLAVEKDKQLSWLPIAILASSPSHPS